MNSQKEKVTSKKDDRHDSSSQAGFRKGENFERQQSEVQSDTAQQAYKAGQSKPSKKADLTNEGSRSLSSERERTHN